MGEEQPSRLPWALLILGAIVSVLGAALGQEVVTIAGLLAAVVGAALGVLGGRMSSLDIDFLKGRLKSEMVGPDEVVSEMSTILEPLPIPPEEKERALEATREDANDFFAGQVELRITGADDSRAHARHLARRLALMMAAGRCAICGAEEPGVLEVAHIEPLVHGGSPDDPENMVLLCRNCHRLYDSGEASLPTSG